ncbi:uncharacterized protein LOC123878440 [Maniola jurtina]|uniref:uncharacterized protein LOC123878440 n=1 Tax=Maniola jurtina TaxID=191418 RepID=UPI001E6871A9|nr:uncharacterized protein LOC123878440 [Maniola jurtina]
MVFKAPRKQVTYEPKITLNGASLIRVQQFKYLGHYVSEDLKDHVDIERERRALAVKCNMLARRFARCSKETKITLFKAYCQNFYSGSLWVNFSKKAIDTLRVQYNNGFRMLLGLPRFCSASGMFADERTDDFFAIMRKKSASLLKRLRSGSNSILNMFASKMDSPMLKHIVKVLIVDETAPWTATHETSVWIPT